MTAPLGRAYWAVAPFAPQPPFRIYAGTGHEPRSVSTSAIVAAVQKGSAQFDVLTPVKARPVLVVTAPLSPFDEVLALRLVRFSKLDEAAQSRVRNHEDDGLFHLQPDTFQGLPEENAAIVSSLIRLPRAAIDTSNELGSVNLNELRVVHERIARVHGLKLDVLVLEQAQRLLEDVRKA